MNLLSLLAKDAIPSNFPQHHPTFWTRSRLSFGEWCELTFWDSFRILDSRGSVGQEAEKRIPSKVMEWYKTLLGLRASDASNHLPLSTPEYVEPPTSSSCHCESRRTQAVSFSDGGETVIGCNVRQTKSSVHTWLLVGIEGNHWKWCSRNRFTP